MAAGLSTYTRSFCGSNWRGFSPTRLGSQSEQVADRVDQIGAVHGVKMEIGDAVVDEIKDLLGRDRGGN
jgi:hypothetical protein